MNYSQTCSKFGMSGSKRQERKFKAGFGLAYKLSRHSWGTDEDGKPNTPSPDEIKAFVDSASSPGPNPNGTKKERKEGSRRADKERRGLQRAKEIQRQKTRKKDRAA